MCYVQCYNKNMIDQKTVCLLIFILLVGVIIRVASFGGYFGSDDGVYAQLANEMARGNYSGATYSGTFPTAPLRVGLIVPTALAFKITGPNELAMVAYPFILSVLSILLAFFAGQMFFNMRVGLIAAAIQAALPIDARMASHLLPDLVMGFWANIGIILLYYGSKKTTVASKIVYGVLSGLCFGSAWLCKEAFVYIVPFICICIVWVMWHQRKNTPLIISVGLVCITILLLESFLYYKYAHDFLYRFHMVEKHYKVSHSWFFPELNRIVSPGKNYLLLVLNRILKDGPRQIFVNQNFGFITGTAILAIVYALFRRLRSFLFPGLWFFSIAFMFNFCSSSIRYYKPLVLFDRYLYPLLLPAVILTSAFIAVLIPCRDSIKNEITRERFFWGATLVIGIISIFSLGVYRNSKEERNSPTERAISRILTPQDSIYTDSRTAWALKFFWKYPEKTQAVDFKAMAVNEVPLGVYVLINRPRADFLSATYGYILPKFYKDIPTFWVLKWHAKQAELYWVPKNPDK